MKKGLMPASPALVIALLALVISLGGTSLAATGYFDGRQIKPHSIPKDRLTKRAIASLRGTKGARGAQGPAGPQGPAGAAGPAGTPGLSGYQTFFGIPVSVAASTQGTATLLCPTGEYPLSGGFMTTTASATLVPLTSSTFYSTVANALGWEVTMYNPGTTSADFEAEIICAKVA